MLALARRNSAPLRPRLRRGLRPLHSFWLSPQSQRSALRGPRRGRHPPQRGVSALPPPGAPAGTAAGLSALRGAVRGIYPAQKSNCWIALKTGQKSDGWAMADFSARCEPNLRGFPTFAHSGVHRGQRRVLRHRRGTDCHPIRGRATRGLKTRNTGRPIFDEKYGCSECGLMIHGLAGARSAILDQQEIGVHHERRRWKVQ